MKPCFLAIAAALIVFALPGKCPGWDRTPTVLGDFISFACTQDGAVLLLSKKNELVRVSPDGAVTSTSLPSPAFPGANGGKSSPASPPRFSDFAVAGNRAVFCRFQEPRLFLTDLSNPSSYHVIDLEGPRGSRFQPMKVHAGRDVVRLLDVDGHVLEIDGDGKASFLPDHTLPVILPENRAIRILPPRPDSHGLYSWSVRFSDGKTVVERRSPDREHNIFNMGVVGSDSKGRLIFLENSGPGEQAVVTTLHAFQDGKVVASKVVEGSGNLTAAKSALPYPLGGVLLMRLTPDGTGVRLIRVAF